MPAFSSFSTVFFESDFSVSATAIIPRHFPPFAKNTGVLPSFASFSANSADFPASIPFCSINLRFPARQVSPSISAFTPKPEKAVKFTASSGFTPFCTAFSQIAFEIGCSDCFSIEKAICSSVFSSVSSGITSVTAGMPFVRVPVLSNRIFCIFPSTSRLCALLTRMPFSAAFPVPTVIATGVASPSAQGQEITSTLIALEKANSKSAPQSSHTAKEITLTAITAGTKYALTLSARRAIGALLPEAFSTSIIIFATVVSSPTNDAFTRIAPSIFLLPA